MNNSNLDALDIHYAPHTASVDIDCFIDAPDYGTGYFPFAPDAFQKAEAAFNTENGAVTTISVADYSAEKEAA